MHPTFQFEAPLAWLALVPIGIIVAFALRRMRKAAILRGRAALLLGLRILALVAIVFICARPVRIDDRSISKKERSVVLLMDRSESMALEESGSSRYNKALEFARSRLLPALKSAGIPVQSFLFDRAAEPVANDRLTSVAPTGDRTDLGAAIAQVTGNAAVPPLGIIALTDGIANEDRDNARALSALVEGGVPFIGVGFGRDEGVCTLSLRSLDSPPAVSPKTAFSVAAQLEIMNGDGAPPFDLVLFRGEQALQKKSIQPGKGSRAWIENFQLSEEKEGIYNYTVQLIASPSSTLKCVNAIAHASVRVSTEKELRILYAQGALTWDYKFINLALRNDRTIKITGLTRTSKQSVFRQNIEGAGELVNGFPTALNELAPYRVVVLSNLRPADLSPAQQDILARFCSELGGGVLMIGGPATFDNSWQASRLEQLLPVVFARSAGVQGLDRAFRMQLTEEALQHPLFQIGDDASPGRLWSQLPTFTQYGRVDSAKAGAQVWARHQTDEGPAGKRILMASQRYGAGISAVLCIQNFWRWRLARESEPQHFDRFWRQMFRFLSDSGRQDVSIHLADQQELRPDMDVRVNLEKQPDPKNLTETSRKFFVRVEDGKTNVLKEEMVELEPLHPVELAFHPVQAGLYTVTVSDPARVAVASRVIEIREINVEFQDTARNMENLKQWASVSDGLAMKAEDCGDAKELVQSITAKIEQSKSDRTRRRPLGLNGWMLGAVAGLLGAEWLLRKKWGLA